MDKVDALFVPSRPNKKRDNSAPAAATQCPSWVKGGGKPESPTLPLYCSVQTADGPQGDIHDVGRLTFGLPAGYLSVSWASIQRARPPQGERLCAFSSRTVL